MEGTYRVDDTPAHRALREALVNCLTNANYYERRGIVCLREQNALSLANPGDFRIDIERAMRGGVSDPRNETLMKMFALVDIGERAGSGLPKIFRGWAECGYLSPFYKEEFGPDRTTLTLPLTIKADQSASDSTAQTKVEERSKRAVKKSGQKAGASDIRKERYEANRKAIIEYLDNEDTARSLDIAAAIGLGKTRTNEILKSMVEEGVIQAEGTTHNRMYRLGGA
ncbi:ATP-binding protein [Raoultibacter phocaeensis]|uniref:ATP-binding protein n=1 Tax=Raoultibacter phocaeensis TaxID=2479841 RepID=UPI00111A6CB4|nr:ATP-binding protein [Raoultibacter phocaeensis]